MILILSDQFDVHVDVVERYLRLNDASYFRLNLDVASLQKTSFTFDEGKWIVEGENGYAESDRISCVWLRRAFVEMSLEEEDAKDVNFKIWRGEWNKTLLGLYSSINHVPWLNPLRENSRTENKYYQMRMASDIGLIMPKTITSNKKELLMDFCSQYREIVVKLMSQDFYRMEDGSLKGIYVNKVSREMLEQFGGSEENPITLQEYIPKSFEVRYTVVGNSHFVCKIESQRSTTANIDWRRYDLPNTPHYQIDPPDDIRRKVERLMSELHLGYGALDFVVTPENLWYFLEVNPTGQWLWIEDLTGLPISDRIASWLLDRFKRGTR